MARIGFFAFFYSQNGNRRLNAAITFQNGTADLMPASKDYLSVGKRPNLQ
jgi:hypothetical protein